MVKTFAAIWFVIYTNLYSHFVNQYIFIDDIFISFLAISSQKNCKILLLKILLLKILLLKILLLKILILKILLLKTL
ncbi:hypothetical protein B5D82_05160 [Cognaticolwellia beringensis]|uniref:Uncharacterized protein n=1 Tax=Cognaticolwellia beringensis TaxID=1967665 RepID=A0A222G5Y3_9GAMM|nr:hypothetical protein B5D82_05160 [Cognaticolwellia beringensis]